MYSSQEITHSPLQIDLKYRRLFKYHNNRKSNQQISPMKNQTKTTCIGSNNGLHFPGKINFHELLSVPLQKQIIKENKVKENQTFFLKFQTELNKKNPKPAPKSLKNQSNNLKKKNKKLIIFTDKRDSLKSQRSQRKNIDNFEKQREFSLKDVSKTMYFKPLGKIIHSNSMSQRIERKRPQFEENNEIIKSNEDYSVQIRSNSYRDKLLMLLQIRRNQKNQRQSNLSKAKSSFSRYGNITQRQFYSTSKMVNQNNQQNHYKTAKWENSNIRYKRNHQKNMNKDELSNDDPTPWQLTDHIEDF